MKIIKTDLVQPPFWTESVHQTQLAKETAIKIWHRGGRIEIKKRKN